MKLYVFDDYRLGAATPEETLVDITGLVSEHVAPEDRMTALITAWPDVQDEATALVARGGGPSVSAVRLRAPQPRPRDLFAAPVNYRKHQAEMGGPDGVYKDRKILTVDTAKGFLKAASSVVGPDGTIELPWPDRRFDHEAEIGVVIGREAKRVSEEEALSYVFGYTPLMDITLRGDEDRSFRKSMDTFTPIGPHILTADEVTDPGNLDFWLTVNGELRQKSNTSFLIYGIAKLIATYSEVITLQPGDIIATGTPEGVGPIVSGDTVVLTIPAIGELTMTVTAPDPA